MFNNTESPNRPQKLHIQWQMRTIEDESADRPDQMCDGFWPSTDSEDAGFIGENPATPFEQQMEEAQARMDAFDAGDWGFVGIVAVANLLIPIGGGSFRIMTLQSAGLWGIESDSGEYLLEVYEDEKASLLGELKTLGEALASGDFVEEDPDGKAVQSSAV